MVVIVQVEDRPPIRYQGGSQAEVNRIISMISSRRLDEVGVKIRVEE